MTPLMKQYWDIKSLHPDKVLLFRMGDFFEMFHDDAVTAAPIIGIALTSRNKKAQDETPMCGVPHFSIAGPINKLLSSGHKVAICDQIEDPKMAKGLVKRAVTRILTPGMVYDSETLRADISNYMASFDGEALSLLDTSSGEAFYLHASTTDFLRFLQLLPVVELVVDKKQGAPSGSFIVTEFQDLSSDLKLPISARRLLAYCKTLGGEASLQTLKNFEERKLQKRLGLSATVLRHLEVFETYLGDTKGSFFEAIDRTRTSGGRRKLRSELCFPKIELKELQKEQARVQAWSENLFELKKIREVLGGVGDLERRIGRLATPQANGRDLLSLAESVLSSTEALALAKNMQFSKLRTWAEEIKNTILEAPPLTVKQGGVIQRGVSKALDECIELATDSHSLLAQMEEKEKKATGISSLKIRYNNVFGFFIEITNTHKDKVPSHYMRKQTVANAERFYTEELIELEKKVLTAQARRFEMEYEIFEDLRQKTLLQSKELLILAGEISDLDVITSLAWLIPERNYVLPVLGGSNIEIKSSRHSVVEQNAGKSFVPNDISIGPSGCLLLTGPNMAGKSTLMRQVALTALLAQIGGPVPATKAELPVFDAIFTRIGASDQLSQGLSTFMVEMTETAEMLEKATAQSLVILDEVGRGTSTYDGLSLAQSILEFLVMEKKSFILFATHYHELTGLSEDFKQIENAHMSVGESHGEKGSEIRFLHTLKKGPAGKSYGIQVARLAGVPAVVTERAKRLLKEFEKKSHHHLQANTSSQMSLLEFEATEPLPPPRNLAFDELLQSLGQFKVSQRTPLEALNQIADWQVKWQDITSSQNNS